MSILSADNLSVRLGDKTVLNGVGAVFAPGLVTAVVGPNGAGKSTLLDCLAALRKPDAGRVTLDERALGDLSSRERARRIAYLPQNAEIAWAVDGRTFVGLGRTPYVGAWGLTAEDRAARPDRHGRPGLRRPCGFEFVRRRAGARPDRPRPGR